MRIKNQHLNRDNKENEFPNIVEAVSTPVIGQMGEWVAYRISSEEPRDEMRAELRSAFVRWAHSTGFDLPTHTFLIPFKTINDIDMSTGHALITLTPISEGTSEIRGRKNSHLQMSEISLGSRNTTLTSTWPHSFTRILRRSVASIRGFIARIQNPIFQSDGRRTRVVEYTKTLFSISFLWTSLEFDISFSFLTLTFFT